MHPSGALRGPGEAQCSMPSPVACTEPSPQLRFLLPAPCGRWVMSGWGVGMGVAQEGGLCFGGASGATLWGHPCKGSGRPRVVCPAACTEPPPPALISPPGLPSSALLVQHRRGAAGRRPQLQPQGHPLVADARHVQPPLQDEPPVEHHGHRGLRRRGEVGCMNQSYSLHPYVHPTDCRTSTLCPTSWHPMSCLTPLSHFLHPVSSCLVQCF